MRSCEHREGDVELCFWVFEIRNEVIVGKVFGVRVAETVVEIRNNFWYLFLWVFGAGA